MKEQDIILKDFGREAGNVVAELVQNCCRYDSTIRIIDSGKKYNPKSIFSTMTLNLVAGKVVMLTVDGNDEEYAMGQLIRFLAEEKEYKLGGVI